jgi:hypothetical protein
MMTRTLQSRSELFAESFVLPLAAHASRMSARYEFEVATAFHDRPDLLDVWRRMLDAGTGAEKLYQTPEFFASLADNEQPQGERHELFIVRRSVDFAIVGVVPVRTIALDLDFRFGPVSLFKRSVRVCQILGSTPLLDPAERHLHDFVTRQLLARYPDCGALFMQAVPQAAAPAPLGVVRYVLNGWRECHTQPLPESVDAYLQKFSSKKRYNLTRQVRLLAQEAGDVQVVRIEHPEQVAAMLDARQALAPGAQADRAARQATLEGLARQGLLLAYVIRCGTEDVALVSGTRSSGVWHVHNIHNQPKYLHLSVGTSAMHLALQDVLTLGGFSRVDFGYGSPNSEFRSIHTLDTRGSVLLYRSHTPSGLLMKTHGVCSGMNEALIRQVKLGQKKIAQLKQRLREVHKAHAARAARPADDKPAAKAG